MRRIAAIQKRTPKDARLRELFLPMCKSIGSPAPLFDSGESYNL